MKESMVSPAIAKALDKANQALSNKTSYEYLGNIAGSTNEEIIINAWNAIQKTGEPVNVEFSNAGIWAGIAYKYSGTVEYGYLLVMRYNRMPIALTVNNGTKTVQELALKSDFLYQDFIDVMPDNDISAGTPGTRGAQKTLSINIPSGYVVTGMLIKRISHSDYHIPLVFMSGNTAYVNWYRAVDYAVSKTNAQIDVRVIYGRIGSV